MFLGNLGLNMWLTDYYGFKAGFLAIENNLLLDKCLSKPWGKLFATALGAMLASFYYHLLHYRMLANDQDKKNAYPKLHMFHSSPWANRIMLVTGLGLILMLLTVSHPAIADPYSWSNFQNMMFNGPARGAFCAAVLFTFIPMLTGHFNIGRDLLCTPTVRLIGCAVFIIAICHPVLIGLLYNAQ